MSIWEALPILQNGIIACVIAALVCSFLGVYVVLKRIVFMSAALSQVSSLGVAVALPLQVLIWNEAADNPLTESPPLVMIFPIAISLLFSCSAALIMANQTTEKRLSQECILGIAYIVPAALALLILDSTGGTVNDINNILFGNTVVVPIVYVWSIVIAAGVVMLMHGTLYKEFIFVSFDSDTAKTAGLKTALLNRLLFSSLAVMISVSIVTIGILPVFSFMVLPPATAILLTTTLKNTFIFSVIFGGMAALTGFYLSFLFSLPTGPAIITVEAILFLVGVLRNMARH